MKKKITLLILSAQTNPSFSTHVNWIWEASFFFTQKYRSFQKEDNNARGKIEVNLDHPHSGKIPYCALEKS